MAAVRGWTSDSMNTSLRHRAEADRLQQEIRLLREEIRIKDARMRNLEPQKRPLYPPTERLAILELRAARSWSLAQTARTVLATPLSIDSWTARLDDDGPDDLVRLPEPVNRFPEFVGYIVRSLKILCSAMGRVRIARVLARAGLHLNFRSLIVPILALSAIGLISAFAGVPGRAHRPAVTAAEPGSKDCSKVKDCKERCQCEYDQCARPCGVYETECVKACIKTLNTCKDACKN
jgi:hypothetical protein